MHRVLLRLLMLLVQQPICTRREGSLNAAVWTHSNSLVATIRHSRLANAGGRCTGPRLLRHATTASAQLGASIDNSGLRMFLQARRRC